MQIGQLVDVGRGEGAALTLLRGGPAGVPHLEVGDQLGPTVEDVDQRHRPVRSDQPSLRIDLDHREAAPGGGDRVALSGAGLLPDPKPVQFGLERGPVGNRGPGRIADRRHSGFGRLVRHCRSQVAMPPASAAARLTWDRASVSVRCRRRLVTAIVTHLVTRSPRMFSLSLTWDHVFQLWSPGGSSFLGELGMGSSGVTWYDVLGLLPGATVEQVQRQYDSKARLLRPELVAGASSPVVAAASRAQEFLDAARRVLADPASRARYDQAVGIRRSGGGLARRGDFPSQPGSELLDADFIAGDLGSDVLGALLALTDWLTPHPRQPGQVAVPDVRGLFYSVCLQITGKLGLRLAAVRLTGHPMPVDGLVVDQSPRTPVKTRRGSTLTVHVWHPPVRSAHPG